MIQRDRVEAAVLDSAKGILSRHSVSLTEDFFALGADSLDAVELAQQLAEKVGADIGGSEVFAAQTLGDLVELIESRMRADGDPR